MTASKSLCTLCATLTGAGAGAAVASATIPLVTNIAEQAAKTAYIMCFIKKPQTKKLQRWADAKDASACRQKFGAAVACFLRGLL